jgi:transcriptional regulator with XRE-family HTH domain
MPAKLGRLRRRDELGLALSFLRWLKGWTQKQVVAAAGVSLSGLRALEQKGRSRRPTLRTLGQVTAALGADLALLFEVETVIRELRQPSQGPARREAAGGAGSRGAVESPATTVGVAFRRNVAAVVIEATGRSPEAAGASREAGQPLPPAAPAMDSGKELGLALTLLRWSREWEQRDLAAASGIAVEAIQGIEIGRRRRLPAELPALLAALGMGPAALTRVTALVSKLRRHQGAAARQPAPLSLDSWPRAWTPALRDQVAVLLHAEVQPAAAVGVASAPEEKRRLSALWSIMAGCAPEAQLELVRQVAEFQTPGFCELLCEESLAAAGDSAQRARRLAELAAAAAELVRGTAGFRSRLRGLAGVHVGNALRVEGRDLPAAGAMLDGALVAWEAGAGDDPGLLNAARVHGLTASMRRAQRRLPEALAALDEGLRIDRWGETPALLLAKARALVELGEFEASIEQLQQAVPWIEGEGEPRQLYVVENLLVLNLCHLGQHEAAERRLPRLRQLALRLGNQLDLLRVDWLAGKVAAGRGRPDEALALLLRVRSEFMAEKNFYVAALLTVELAEVHAGLGHTAEVKALARESAPIFEDQQVHREAQRALAVFRQAAEEERVSGELLRQLIVYLYRARHDPQLRFAAAA